MMKHHIASEAVSALIDGFDCVVMVDDASTDNARLRRDAMRLCSVLPVVVVQSADAQWWDGMIPPGVERYSAALPLNADDAEGLAAFLGQRGVRHPLLWFGEPGTADVLSDAWPNALRVIHLSSTAAVVDGASRRPAQCADLFIADDEAGATRARTEFGNGVSVAVIADDKADTQATPSRPIAFSDASLGVALAPTILHALVHRLPWWDFHIAGDGARLDAEWDVLRSHPNVRDHGALGDAAAASMLKDATAVLLPCVAPDDVDAAAAVSLDQRGVSGVPIIASPALGQAAGVTLASSLDAFGDNLRRAWAYANLTHSARASNWLESLAEAVHARVRTMLAAPVHGRLNILMLYDDHSTFTSTVREHLESFAAYSRHSFHYMPATSTPIPSSESFDIDLSIFDAIIVHYSVRLSLPDFLQARIAAKIERFHGLKFLFIQDEYETTETARSWMERLGFDIVYTCVPPAGREYVYPAHRLPRIEFRSTLTGYVPLDSAIDNYALPIEARSVRIAYRGRMLPYRYGTLGWEKYRIGVDVKRMAEERGISVDIEVDDCKRIYGSDWYRFLGSARATLGTESGSNVFDFDGSVASRINEMLAADPETPFKKVFDEVLAPLEPRIRMNQISPKIFEAARLRTALILFEGEYSGIIKPYEHYLPLRSDYSNIDEVLAALEDIPRLQAMTDRVYRDLITSGKYSYQAFVRGIDADIESRWLRGPRNRIFAAPAMICNARGDITRLPADQAAAWALFDEVLTSTTTRFQSSALFTPYVPPPPPEMTISEHLRLVVKRVRSRIGPLRSLPGRVLLRLMRMRVFVRAFRPLWHMLPARLRRSFVALLWH
jgi:hypothetical protein